MSLKALNLVGVPSEIAAIVEASQDEIREFVDESGGRLFKKEGKNGPVYFLFLPNKAWVMIFLKPVKEGPR